MRVSLSFDDGPSAWTPPLLEVLRAHDARATFFVIGERIEQHGNLIRGMLDEGHEVGNHTWSHRPVREMTDADLHADLERTNSVFYYETGQRMTLWRSPYLGAQERHEAVGKSLGLRHSWPTCAPADWMATDPKALAAAVRANLRDGAVIDLHDGVPPDGGSGTDSRQVTVDAVTLLLADPPPSAQFVTVSSL